MKTRRNQSARWVRRTLLVMTALLLSQGLHGAEANEPATGEHQDEDRTTPPTADQSAASNQADTQPEDESFTPSEEISEDFAVSFPVDI